MKELRKLGLFRKKTAETPIPQISYEYALNRLAEYINPTETLPTNINPDLAEIIDLFRPLMDNPHIEDPWKIINVLEPGAVHYSFERQYNRIRVWLPAAVTGNHPAFSVGMPVSPELLIDTEPGNDETLINPHLAVNLSSPIPSGGKEPTAYLSFQMYRQEGRQCVDFIRGHTSKSGNHKVQTIGFEETHGGWQEITPED